MNFEQLGQAWREENAARATAERREQLIAATCRRVERFWGQVLRRDLIETAAALFVMVAFGAMLFAEKTGPLEKTGCGVIVLGAAYVVYRLHKTRRSTRPAPLDAPLREYCQTELRRVEQQIKLLKSVHVWYLGPISLGLVLISLGRHGLAWRSAEEIAFYTVLFAGIYVLNQLAVKRGLVPLRDGLRSLRDALDSPNQAERDREEQ